MSAVLPINEDPRFRLSTATGGQTVFSVPFPFQANADITVIRIDGVTGDESVLVEGANYTLTGAGAAGGGSVTLTLGATAGDIYLRLGQAVLSRVWSVVRAGMFRSRPMDDDLDRALLISQELNREIERAWRAPYGETGGRITPGTGLEFAQFDGNGNIIPGPTEADLVAEIIAEAGGSFASVELSIYDTRPLASAARPAVAANIVQTRGYDVAGDGGGASYRKVVSEPAHGAKLQMTLVGGSTVWYELAEVEPTILQFGAKDDGVTSGHLAFAAAKAFLASNGRTLHLPYRNSGVYFVNAANGTIDLRGFIVTVDRGVRLRGQVRVDAEIRLRDDLPFDYDDGSLVYDNFLLSKDQGRLPHLKENFIHEVERKVMTPLNFDTLSPVKLSFAAGDSWVADGGMSTSADVASINLAADDFMHAIFAPVRGGDEIELGFDNGPFIKASIVRFVGGYMAFYSGIGGGVFRTKLTGVAASENSGLTWFGLADDTAWGPTRAVWKIRIYNSRRFAVMLNGLQLFDMTTPGPIVDAGFGIHYLASTILASMSYMTKTRRTQAYGHSPARLFIAGDSTSARQMGSWEYYCKELLDGTHGMRVWDVFNQAHAGDDSGDQLTLMNTNVATLEISTHLVIFIGINDDMSSGAAIAAALANVDAMIVFANAHGFGDNARITIVIPHLWYTQAMSGGSGVAAGTNNAHGLYRAGLKKIAARRGCRLVDLPEVLAAITPADLSRVDDVYPYLRDNVHETNYAYKVVGEAVAREMVAGSSIEMTQAEARTLFDASLFQNGWTSHGSGQEAGYTVSKDGVVMLSGLMDKGTTGTVVIMNLPANLRPPAMREFYARTSNGAVAIIYAAPNGDVTVSSFPATVATYVSLDNISFQLA